MIKYLCSRGYWINICPGLILPRPYIMHTQTGLGLYLYLLVLNKRLLENDLLNLPLNYVVQGRE